MCIAARLAANVLAVAVPCHRVIRNDGGLAGYRGGLKRKAAFTEKESHTRMNELNEDGQRLDVVHE